MQPHKIVVHYCGDGGQCCSHEKSEAMINDPRGVLELFRLIKQEQSNPNHYCPNKGIAVEIIPLTRGTT